MEHDQYVNIKTQIPGPKSKDLLDNWVKYEADKTGYQAQIAVEHAEGVYIFDADGNRFIDWTSGVLVTNVGHCHPKLVKSMNEAANKILNVYEYCNEYRVNAAKALVESAPIHLDRCFFLTSGSEATDSAMRIMKRATSNYEIISFFGGFHGRTMSTGSAGGLCKTKKGYGPSTPGFIRTPFPYCYRCMFNSTPSKCGFMCLDFLDDIVMANSTDSLAGLIVEPYLGAGGFIFPPDGWMKSLQKWINEKKILFTLDEVQSSFGRTGKMWASEWEDLSPDIVTVGKGVGSGASVSALLMRKKLADFLGKGELGSTYGGNPVSCAAVSAVIDIMNSEKVIDNVKLVEPIFKERLNKISARSKHLGDVRGRGLVWGLEMVEDKNTKIPSSKITTKVIDECAKNGLLVGKVGIYGNVIRVAPPLIINVDEANASLDILEKVMKNL